MPNLWLLLLVGWIVGGGLGLIEPVQALEADRHQPVYIEADQAELDEQKGITVYRGNVSLTQGSMVLTGAVVTSYHAAGSRALIRVIAEGSPVRFRQRPSSDKEEVHATAPRMEYEAEKQLVHLVNGGEVTQGRNTFRGNRIDYHIDDNRVSASSGNTPGERVRATLFPQEHPSKGEGGRTDKPGNTSGSQP